MSTKETGKQQNLYVTESARAKLELLADKECRTLVGELEYLCDLRINEIIPKSVNQTEPSMAG